MLPRAEEIFLVPGFCYGNDANSMRRNRRLFVIVRVTSTFICQFACFLCGMGPLMSSMYRYIYMLDPTSIVRQSARRAQTSLLTKVRSETTISYKPPDLSSMSEDSDSEDEDDGSGSSLHVARRYPGHSSSVVPCQRAARRCRAHSLTDGKLAAIKKVIRCDLP